MRSTSLAAFTPFLFMLACSSSSNLGTSSDAGSTAPTGDAPGSACNQYLTCVSAAAPSQFPTALAAYGPNGTCWSAGAQVAAQCETSCTAGMKEITTTQFVEQCGTGGDSVIGSAPTPDADAGSSNSGSIATGSGAGSGGTGSSSTETCNECANKECATPLDDCSLSENCTDTFTCIGKCSNPADLTCENACIPAGTSSADLSISANLLTCLNDSCGGGCDPF